ncbi:hypothetical protein T439DRAFT_323859 [Meredithblackwellia eburnea MCA 4105]
MAQQRTNNPFATSSSQSQLEATANRFPDVSQDPALYQNQQQFIQPQQQQQQFTTYQQPQYQQQQTGSYSGFQPQSFSGQQISAQVTGLQQAGQSFSANNYAQQQQNPQFGYNQQQQHQQSPAGYGQYNGASTGYGGGAFGQAPTPQPQSFVSDLDPYANLGSLQNVGPQQQQQRQQQQSTFSQQNQSQTQQPENHPKVYVQRNKDALMQWDEYTWKQLLNRVDGLREAWEARKMAVLDVTGKGGDTSTIENLRKQAENNIDSIHASKLQISEVKQGWRHSTDPASKARVREALNAGLNSLPEFPTALQPEQLGGIFAQRATDEFRKNQILANFNTPQQQGFAPLFAQPTGYPGAGGGYQQQQPQTTMGYGVQQQGYVQAQPTGFYGGYPQQGGGGHYYG